MSDTANIIEQGWKATSNVKVAAYGVAEGSAVDFGFTKGGVTIAVDGAKYDIKVDQWIGTIDQTRTDQKVTITVPIASVTLANLAMAAGLPVSAVSGSILSMGNYELSKKTLYINVMGPNGSARKYTFWKCIATGKTSQEYKQDGETLVDVEFDVLVDTSKAAASCFGQIEDTPGSGDAPTVAMTVPASGGTRTAGGKTALTFTFTTDTDAVMDESTLIAANVQVILEGGGLAASTVVAGALSYNPATKVMTFTPAENWEAGNYSVIMTTDVQDSAHVALAAAFSGYFTVSA